MIRSGYINICRAFTHLDCVGYLVKGAIGHQEDGKPRMVNTPWFEKQIPFEEPEIFRHGNQFGVKLRANAPSLHFIRADISTEVSPVVGTEKQSEELVRFLLQEFEQNPEKIWDTNMFGKSLHDMVKEQLQNKLYMMPEDTRMKLQKTLQKIINEGSGGFIAIIL